jgi:hypothetical protein
VPTARDGENGGAGALGQLYRISADSAGGGVVDEHPLVLADGETAHHQRIGGADGHR